MGTVDSDEHLGLLREDSARLMKAKAPFRLAAAQRIERMEAERKEKELVDEYRRRILKNPTYLDAWISNYLANPHPELLQDSWRPDNRYFQILSCVRSGYKKNHIMSTTAVGIPSRVIKVTYPSNSWNFHEGYFYQPRTQVVESVKEAEGSPPAVGQELTPRLTFTEFRAMKEACAPKAPTGHTVEALHLPPPLSTLVLNAKSPSRRASKARVQRLFQSGQKCSAGLRRSSRLAPKTPHDPHVRISNSRLSDIELGVTPPERPDLQSYQLDIVQENDPDLSLNGLPSPPPMSEGPTPLPDDDDPTFFEVRSTGSSCESSQEEGRTSPPSLFHPEGELQPRDFLQVDRYTSDDVQRLNDPDNEPPSQLLADPLPSNAGMTGSTNSSLPDEQQQRPYYAPYPNQSSIWTPGTGDSHRSRRTIFGVS
ncbi:hypothetical protein CVT26_012884 [Gymnopilus dilepis]|uniref:Uncharacterized protein n=1 Tax=Gymnopilus dilepis TaxID=231916 RepID=A0A409YNV2_9AGAR|nr:hypothetical protein CVT26_012884 [Gymnopilus dilepis]